MDLFSLSVGITYGLCDSMYIRLYKGLISPAIKHSPHISASLLAFSTGICEWITVYAK